MVFIDNFNKVKVLVAENDKNTLNLIVDIIGPFGCTIYTAQDGMQAIEICQKYKPDLVLLDFEMPYVDGLTVLREIKATDQDMAVILFTGINSYQDLMAEAMRMGADLCVHKPFSVQLLKEKIIKYLNRDKGTLF